MNPERFYPDGTPALPGVNYNFDLDAQGAPESYSRDWGQQWEDKDLLNGVTVTIVGMREAADFGVGPTVAILFRGDNDDSSDTPWGCLFSTTSPIVQQIASHFHRRGRTALRAKLLKSPSKSNKGFSYWQLAEPDPMPVNSTPEPSKTATSSKGGK